MSALDKARAAIREQLARKDSLGKSARATVIIDALMRLGWTPPPEEPKPWLEAKDGEIWALTGAGGVVQPWLRDGDDWVHSVVINKRRVYPKPEGIIAGHRIWPVSETTEEQ